MGTAVWCRVWPRVTASTEIRERSATCAWKQRERKKEMTTGTKLMGYTTDLCAKATTRTHELLKSTKGQGTTEYAILVGVLVVIAILAIVVFRPKLQELWNAIVNGFEQL